MHKLQEKVRSRARFIDTIIYSQAIELFTKDMLQSTRQSPETPNVSSNVPRYCLKSLISGLINEPKIALCK